MKTTLLSCLFAAAITLPVDVQAAEKENYGSAEAQTNVLLACRDALGVSADLSIYTLDFDDGRVLLSALNRGGISLTQARSINRCKRESLAANPRAWEATATPAQPARTELPQQVAVGAATLDYGWHSTTCPPGFNGLFRGTLYCENGRPMK